LNLDRSLNNLSHTLNRIYPYTASGNYNDDGINYWKHKRIISADKWLEIKQGYSLTSALQSFPDDFLISCNYYKPIIRR
jgi:hypothetical protein